MRGIIACLGHIRSTERIAILLHFLRLSLERAYGKEAFVFACCQPLHFRRSFLIEGLTVGGFNDRRIEQWDCI